MQQSAPNFPRTILHIGPPKSGTTTLQEQVFPQLRSICFLGKRWWNPHLPYEVCVALHRAIDTITKAPPGQFDAQAARAALNDWVAHAPQWMLHNPDGSTKVWFLSEERLAWTDVVGHDEIAQRLSLLFPGAEIVYTLRDPIASVQSGYNWLYARAWTDQSFSDWLASGLRNPNSAHTAAIILACFDWPRIKATHAARFPVVRMMRFEALRQDPARFIADLCGADPAETAQFAAINDSPLNATVKGPVIGLHRMVKKSIRLWNRLPFGKIDEKPEYLGDTLLWQRLERALSVLPHSDHKRRASAADREVLRAAFAFYYQDTEAATKGYCGSTLQQSR